MSSTQIPNDDRARVAAALSGVLADTFLLYVKVHGFHWNARGPRFRMLHLMFEDQYNELWSALDPIAERIRALGQPAPGTLQAYAALSSLPETAGMPSASEMIQAALSGHEHVARRAAEALRVAEAAQDVVTADVLTERIGSHEKTAWMLRALLEDGEATA
ncbi:DNA starvation/stationary phase protection protein [Roseomonas eburnea]|uniref:DNA starvation/stationary phase protection protein n=1 Tax=Neoroseomonas eburnea TaxID=1346889 RepID=A0A9X9XBZ0_9PROT|nr:DNA starvation/stationary phase protection protein [Neoroseomonas eburnea]MBR0681226.1 DNA starvation/stationary phase protection protein [Neoroseomonas eburnea]